MIIKHDEISKNLMPINFGIIKVWFLCKLLSLSTFVAISYYGSLRLSPTMFAITHLVSMIYHAHV